VSQLAKYLLPFVFSSEAGTAGHGILSTSLSIHMGSVDREEIGDVQILRLS
jgi:hypothetical protein